MALSISDLRKQAQGAEYVSDVRICLTADGRLTTEDDPAAVRLLVAAGSSIPVAEARKYGLIAEPSPPATGKARKGTEDKAGQ